MPLTALTGSCLCGKVRYEITGDTRIFQYCHCSRCRKFTGSAHAANLLIAPEQLHWLAGEQYLGRYEPADSKHFATAFCRHCGSSLPWLGKSKKAVVVPAGTLDTKPEIQPQQNIFWGSKAPWYEGTGDLPKYEELPSRNNR